MGDKERFGGLLSLNIGFSKRVVLDASHTSHLPPIGLWASSKVLYQESASWYLHTMLINKHFLLIPLARKEEK